MTAHEPILRAFGGGPLKGDNFVRYVYLDEAGTSAKERVVTVAGVVIHADKHLRALKRRLDKMRDNLPEELGADLIFHAKDIWHGNKDFDHKKWDAHGIYIEERRSLVTQICSIPEEFNLPVVHGVVDKERHFGNFQRLIKSSNLPKHFTPNRLSYAVAFGACTVEAEAFLREQCGPREAGHIVAEDTQEMKAHAEWAYSLLERRNAPWSADYNRYVPLERFAEGPMFAAKSKSPLLQIADSIAFVLSRHFSKGLDSDVRHCYEKLLPKLTMPKHWDEFDQGW